jgi:hypothetical protein
MPEDDVENARKDERFYQVTSQLNDFLRHGPSLVGLLDDTRPKSTDLAQMYRRWRKAVNHKGDPIKVPSSGMLTS